MTFVGKILVVLNLFAAILFLGFAAAEFNAKQGLQSQVAKLEKDKKDADKIAQEAKTNSSQLEIASKKLENDLKTAQRDLEQQRKTRDDTIENLSKDSDQYRKQADVTTQRVKQTADEIAARKLEVEQLLKLRGELMDKNIKTSEELSKARDSIQDLKNQLEREQERLRMAEQKRTQLLNYLASVDFKLPSDSEIEAAVASTPPPQVEGVVKKVEGDFIEISLGENDNLRRKHKLQVWRTEPTPQYLGEVVVVETRPNRAVVQPEGRMLGPVKPNDKVGISPLLYR